MEQTGIADETCQKFLNGISNYPKIVEHFFLVSVIKTSKPTILVRKDEKENGDKVDHTVHMRFLSNEVKHLEGAPDISVNVLYHVDT